MPVFRHGDVHLAYDVQGDGPPLLLIAGLGLNAGVWQGVLPLLQDRYTVITFDNRGTGSSSVPPGPWTIDQMADDTAALVRDLALGPVAAVGWSLGGSVLQSLLIRHGDVLDRAVLLNAFPSYTGLQHGWLDCLLALRAGCVDPHALAMFGMAWSFTPRFLTDHEGVADFARLALADPRPTGFEGFAAQAHGLRRYDSRADLHRVRTPTLVLTGAEDVLTPPSQSIEIAEGIPGAHLRILPRGGHAMILEYMAETLAAIDGWLAGHPG